MSFYKLDYLDQEIKNLKRTKLITKHFKLYYNIDHLENQ